MVLTPSRPDDEVKVKFGRDNGEVYAEVAATRQFWALGFPADHMFPVRVRCAGCPPCIGDLPVSQTGSLKNPQIKEPGRKFLSDLLMQLSDQQLHDLFEVSRFEDRVDKATKPAAIDAWVDAFKKKRGEIASTTCPS